MQVRIKIARIQDSIKSAEVSEGVWHPSRSFRCQELGMKSFGRESASEQPKRCRKKQSAEADAGKAQVRAEDGKQNKHQDKLRATRPTVRHRTSFITTLNLGCAFCASPTPFPLGMDLKIIEIRLGLTRPCKTTA